MQDSYAIPVMLDVTGKRCVVVGGGGVGLRRAKALLAAGAHVVMVALQVHPSARVAGLQVEERAFDPTDLDGAYLAIAATDVEEINDLVCTAAKERGVLVNRADNPDASDITFMSSHQDGPLTVAVHTGGASASAAGRVRDLLVSELDPDWARLLRLALPVRREIQQRVADRAKRIGLLRRLSDEEAMASLKTGGDSALEAYYADIMRDLA